MPTGEDPEKLLPLQVGSFIRETIEIFAVATGERIKYDKLRFPPNIRENPIYASYRSGDSEVFVELGICGDSDAARKVLSISNSETDREFPEARRLFVNDSEPSFLNTTTKLGAFMAWTRCGYYFSAHAKGGEADLDGFMKAFPY